ncbi:Phosphatidylinositol-4-phosphate 5-kinase [Xanthoria parietina]
MPSFLDKHCSEPVSLASDDSSPYEPPHRKSQEKSWYYGARPIGTFSETTTNGGLPNGRKTEGSQFQLVDATPPNLQTLPNGRSSISSDRLGKLHSKNDSNHSLLANQSSNHEHSTDIDRVSSNTLRTTKMEPITTNMEGTATHPAKLESPLPIRKSQDGPSRRSGHARGHSLSAPQSPSSRFLHDKTTEPVQGTFRGETGLPTGRKDSYSGSRFSSPPILPQSPPTAPNSTDSLAHPGAVRLQHRHTLQVPRLATGRTSRDFSLPIGSSSDDPSTDPDRLSPTHATRGSTSLARRPTRSIHSDMYLDEIPQDDDMARWTEIIRQKRASRRKRKDEEEDDRVVVGTKVDMHHVNWVTAYNMLTGIRFTVSRTNAKINRDLTDADFDARHKFSFDITGNELTPSAKYDFKFKDYAPWVFRHIRAHFKLDPADYLVSLTSKYILSELGSPGKSGSFFYFSRDYKYIIKTIHHAEHKLLRKILREYYAHIDKYPNTLLSQFYGLHRVKIPYGRKIHFVVMNNLFPPHRDIHQTFDLKGSTIGRDFKEEDLEKNPRATLKDLNWLRRNYHFEFGAEKKNVFVEQLKSDVALLQKLKIMDYSLLVGIHDLSKGNEENLRDKTLRVFQPGGDRGAEPQPNLLTRTPSKLETQRKARELRQIIKKEKPVVMEKSTSKMPDEMLEERKSFIFYSDDGGFQATHEDGEPGEEIYYLGVIDCLTHYGFIKRAEHLWKGMSNNKSQISPIPPEDYGHRFVKFITGLTKTKEQAERESRSTDQMDGSIHTDRQASFSISRHSTDKVIQKAEKQAQKTEKQGASEDKTRDRTLTAEKTAGATLPVVEEDGEAGGREDDSILRERQEQQQQPPPPPNLGTSDDEANPVSSGETQIVSDLPPGHKHLPSLPFIPRLSMTESSGLVNPAERRWSGQN